MFKPNSKRKKYKLHVQGSERRSAEFGVWNSGHGMPEGNDGFFLDLGVLGFFVARSTCLMNVGQFVPVWKELW